MKELKIEDYRFVRDLTIPLVRLFSVADLHEIITDNDAMWEYMTTGQEGNHDGRQKDDNRDANG